MDSDDDLIREEIDLGGDEEKTDERKHNQLLDAISSLDGKKTHRLSQRTVLTNQISEFNFTNSKGADSKVRLHELVGSLKDTTSHGTLKKQLSAIDKKKVVTVPLPKHEKQKNDRSVAYETTVTDLSKWDPVVRSNRQADQLQFPLEKQDFKLATTDQLVKRFQPRTPLEMQVAALLQGSDNVIKGQQQELTPAEQRALRAMDIEEAKERRLELMKHRALLSYKETKAKWQKKIKSKRYHRLLKKDRQKKEQKQLEEMQKTDPEGYLEQLKLMEKERAQERVSLKHRGASKFGKRQMMYAKYDDKARQEVQDMLQKSRELTKKLDVDSDLDDNEDGVGLNSEDEMNMIHGELQSGKVDNPWMAKPSLKNKPTLSGLKESIEAIEEDNNDEEDEIESESGNILLESDLKFQSLTNENNKKNAEFIAIRSDIDDIDFIFDTAKTEDNETGNNKNKKKRKNRNKKNKSEFTEESNKTKENKSGGEKKKTEKDVDSETKDMPSEDEEEELISEGLVRKRTLEDIDSGGDNDPDIIASAKKAKLNEKKSLKKKKEAAEAEAYVDPNKLFTMDTKMRQVGAGPDIIDNDDDEDMDPEEQQRMTIAQAFADDDVIDEFSKEKGEMIEKNQPKDIDLSLPGWGSWGGDGIALSRKKRRRFTIKAPPAAPRKDMHLGHVILNEEKMSAVTKHQVSSVPFPFRSMDQFEASIRAPIGKTWNTEMAYKQLVKPKVITRVGHIINPMDKSAVFKNEKQQSAVPRKPDMAFDGKSDENKRKQNKKMSRTDKFKKGLVKTGKVKRKSSKH